MTETHSAILLSLVQNEKSRSQLASELKLPPPKVAGILASLVYAGQIIVSGKVKKSGKDVSIYALPSRQAVKREMARAPVKPMPEEDSIRLAGSNLYQIWGGYAQVDKQLTRKLTVRSYIDNQ